jgi:hypothetical protein
MPINKIVDKSIEKIRAFAKCDKIDCACSSKKQI